MKKGAVIFAIVVIAAQSILCFKSYAQNIFDANEFESADIPLIREGDNYYVRPGDGNANAYIVMLPLSGVLYEYADISWDEGLGEVNVTCGTLDVTIKIGSKEYVINGERAELDAPPEIIDGITYVPSSFFEKTFGFWITDTGEGILDLFIPGYIIENI